MAASGLALFSEKQVIKIRKEFAAGKSALALSRKLGVSYVTILNLVKGVSYRHVAGPIAAECKRTGKLNHNTQMTSADVIQIRDARSKGVECKVLAKRYGVHASTISEAANGRVWMHIDDMPPPFRVTKNGHRWIMRRLQDRFPQQAFITPAALIAELCASDAWFSRMCEAGKLKTEVRNGIRVIRMRDIERFLRAEYGDL